MNRFKLDETSLSVLKDVFERYLIDGKFVNAEDYRVEKSGLRPLIDKLERRRLLLREGQGQTEYRVSLLSLIALDSNDSRIEIGRCTDVFRKLQDHYRNPLARQNQKFLSELSAELKLTDLHVRNAVMYLRDSGRWIAGGSIELNPPDQAWIKPNENILDYDSFDDVLQELVQNNNPKAFEPVGVADRNAQAARALVLLTRIKSGEQSFQPASHSQSDIQSFQDVARDLDWLYRQGYLQSFKPLRDSQSGPRQVVVAHVGDLTYEGVLYLEQLQKGPSESSVDLARPFQTRAHNDQLKREPSALHPWPIIRGFLLKFDSYDVPGAIDRSGLVVDWHLSEKDNYSHKTRLAAYRGRIDRAFQELPTEEARLRVSYIVAREISEQVSNEELNSALREIGWEARSTGLTPATGDVRELFFEDKSEHDAYVEIRAILQRADKILTIVDPYIDQSILTLLSTCTKPDMSIRLLSSWVPNDFTLEAKKWVAQYKGVTLEVRTTREFHDRFIVLDDTVCWHVGSSIKDAGRKAFMLSQLEDVNNRATLVAQLAKSWASASVLVK